MWFYGLTDRALLEIEDMVINQFKINKHTIGQCFKKLRGGFNPWVREDPLEKDMATHSSILAWKIPWMEEPRRLQSTGSQRVGHN